MAKFAVYFEQVNQLRYEVETRTEAGAIRKASRMWKEENEPVCITVEKEEEQDER